MLVQIAPAPGTQSGPGGSSPLPETREPSTSETSAPGAFSVRPARLADIQHIEPLIREFALENLMLPRSREELARVFREFVVAVDGEDQVVGCGALRVYSEDLAEICSLAVARPVQGLGIGGALVERLVEEAISLGIRRVFALTLRPRFFANLGFGTVSRDEFPLKVWADCRNCPKLHACDEIAVARTLA